MQPFSRHDQCSTLRDHNLSPDRLLPSLLRVPAIGEERHLPLARVIARERQYSGTSSEAAEITHVWQVRDSKAVQSVLFKDDLESFLSGSEIHVLSKR